NPSVFRREKCYINGRFCWRWLCSGTCAMAFAERIAAASRYNFTLSLACYYDEESGSSQFRKVRSYVRYLWINSNGKSLCRRCGSELLFIKPLKWRAEWIGGHHAIRRNPRGILT